MIFFFCKFTFFSHHHHRWSGWFEGNIPIEWMWKFEKFFSRSCRWKRDRRQWTGRKDHIFFIVVLLSFFFVILIFGRPPTTVMLQCQPRFEISISFVGILHGWRSSDCHTLFLMHDRCWWLRMGVAHTIERQIVRFFFVVDFPQLHLEIYFFIFFFSLNNWAVKSNKINCQRIDIERVIHRHTGTQFTKSQQNRWQQTKPKQKKRKNFE
jgi:hypothetical protein